MGTHFVQKFTRGATFRACSCCDGSNTPGASALLAAVVRAILCFQDRTSRVAAVSLVPGQRLFGAGEVALDAYFIRRGKLRYVARSSPTMTSPLSDDARAGTSHQHLSSGKWLAELALWANVWCYRGNADASAGDGRNFEGFALRSSWLQDILLDTDLLEARDAVAAYARSIVSHAWMQDNSD